MYVRSKYYMQGMVGEALVPIFGGKSRPIVGSLPTQMEFEGRSTCKVLPRGKGFKGGVVAGSLL